MKVVILAGGLGTRLQEETVVKPKPMVEIGGRPILWHIMKIFASYGYNEFIIALGYKAEYIKDYFLNYRPVNTDLTVQTRTGKVDFYREPPEDWIVHLVDTGAQTQTGGRLKRLTDFIGQEPFMMTYGDGVADVNIPELIDFHQRQGRLATVTAVHPPARFGEIQFDDSLVAGFAEKPQVGDGWINGGFFVLDPKVLDYIPGDMSPWEVEPMNRLVREKQLSAYRHPGFWQCMDTVRDVKLLETLWAEGRAPWKVW
jgi:glucose-1-phosphate cytidylyltransferase